MVLEVSPLGWGTHAEAKNLFEADVVGEKRTAIYRKAFTMRFVLDTLKFSQNFILVLDKATVDAHGVFL